jgi:hypothetical protein
MEQWNKHGFNVDGWGQVFKVFKQHISTMNTKCFLAPPPIPGTTGLYGASGQYFLCGVYLVKYHKK